MKRNWLILVFSFFITCVFSQNIEFTKEQFKDRKDALKLILKDIAVVEEIMLQEPHFYKTAIPLLLKINEFNPSNAMVNYFLGKSYSYSNEKSKAIFYIEKAINLNPAISDDVYYFLAKAYHLDMQWDKASQAFNTFLAGIKVSDNIELVKQVKHALQQIANGKKLVKNSIRVEVKNLGDGINSPYPDYSPFIPADESLIIFTSRRPSTLGGGKDPFINEYFEDIYISSLENNKFSSALNMGNVINTEGHDSNCSLSADGQRFLVYKDVGHGDLFESYLEGTTWSKPQALPSEINSDAHESSASYSPDGKKLFFVSDKKGGLGGRDIYVSIKNAKGKWTEAVNLGPTINTEFDEEGVFIHPDGKTLYFSSIGHFSMGGYDVFKTVFDEKTTTWSMPENVGYPFNTTDDDVFFSLSANGIYGYYSSIRSDSYGEKDVYRVTFYGKEKEMNMLTENQLIAGNQEALKVAQPIFMKIQEVQLTLLKGCIVDDNTNNPIQASIEIVDIEKNIPVANFLSNSITGKYLISMPAGRNYGITVKKDDYLFHSENFNIPNTSEYEEVVKEIRLKKISVGSKIVLKNIFFDYGKSTLRKESTNEIDRLRQLLQEVPNLKIELSGHTDSHGSDEYNKSLSNARSRAVYDRLVALGVSANRLTFVGFGEEQPIATNENDEGRQQNRRTEFKITAN